MSNAQKKVVKIRILQDSAYKGSIMKFCKQYFERRLELQLQYEQNVYTISAYAQINKETDQKKKQTKLTQQAFKLLDQLKSTSLHFANEAQSPYIIFCECNRLFDQTGPENAYGKYVSKHSVTPVNGRAIMLFDGQHQAYKFPYSYQTQGWIQFNKIFKNYWHSSKQDDGLTNSTDSLQFRKRIIIHAFLDSILYRSISTPIDVFVMQTKQQKESELFSSPNNILPFHQVLHLNDITANIILLDTEQMTNRQLLLISLLLKKSFQLPESIIFFFRDDYEYKFEVLTDNSTFASWVTAKKSENSRNNWKFFLQPSYYASIMTTATLRGFSTAFINPNMSKLTNKIIEPELALKNYCYYSGFTPQNLRRVIQLRSVGQYIKRNPQVLKSMSVAQSPDKKKKQDK